MARMASRCLVVLVLVSVSLAAQLGSDMVGNKFGLWMATNAAGTRVATYGRAGNGDLGTAYSFVRVFDFSGVDWVQVGSDIEGPRGFSFGDYGTPVIMNDAGDRLALGATVLLNSQSSYRTVQVFVLQGGSWVQLGQTLQGRSWLGYSMSFDSAGNRLALVDANNAYTALSEVQVYDFSGGSWVRRYTITDEKNPQSDLVFVVRLNGAGDRMAVYQENNYGFNYLQGRWIRTYRYQAAGDVWIPFGGDIVGTDQGFGRWISFNNAGDVVSAGGPSQYGALPGYVVVFRFDGISWIQMGQRLGLGTEQPFEFSYKNDLSASGNRIVFSVSTHWKEGGDRFSPYYGRVFVYDFDGTSWTFVFDAYGSGFQDDFGFSVAINAAGTRLAVGAPQNQNPGYVRVFELPPASPFSSVFSSGGGVTTTPPTSVSFPFTTTSTRTGSTTTSGFTSSPVLTTTRTSASSSSGTGGATTTTRFSPQPSISTSTTSPLFSSSAMTGGTTTTRFTSSTTTSWTGSALQTAPSGSSLCLVGRVTSIEPFDTLGFAVAISSDGRRVAVGAPRNNSQADPNRRARVRVYERAANGGTVWTQLGHDLEYGSPGDGAGFSVSMNAAGTVVAAGSPFNDNGNGTDTGLVYGGSEWGLVGNVLTGGFGVTLLGYSVSLNAIGDRVAVGAVSPQSLGAVRVFYFDGFSWQRYGRDILGPSADDKFGGAVSLNAAGNRVVVGASSYDDTAQRQDAGLASVFELDPNGAGWIQLGASLLGSARQDAFGQSVSINAAGNRIAVGAPGADRTGIDTGSVTMYEFSSGAWLPVGQTIAGATISFESFGSSVALNAAGDFVAVGAPGNKFEQLRLGAGAIRLYQQSGSVWKQIGSDAVGDAGDQLGWAVALSAAGDTLAAGAPRNTVQTSDPAQHYGGWRAYQLSDGLCVPVVATSSPGVATTTAQTTSSSSECSLQFVQRIGTQDSFDLTGWSVSVSGSGTRVAIGAPRYDFEYNPSEAYKRGRIRVYERAGSTWRQLGGDIVGEQGQQNGYTVALNAEGTVLITGGGRFDRDYNVRLFSFNGADWVLRWRFSYGPYLAINAAGDRIAMSTIFGPSIDHVQVLELREGSWVQLGRDIYPQTDGRPTSIALNSVGDRVAVGSVFRNVNTGAVRVFQYDGADWVQLGGDINGDAHDDGAGNSVSLSASGNRVAVGVPGSDARGPDTGQTRVYEYSGSAWVQLGTVIHGATEFERSGTAVSLNGAGDVLAVGAPNFRGAEGSAGKARVYSLAGGSWVQVGSDITGDRVNELGFSVSLSASDGVLATGAPDYGSASGDPVTLFGHARMYNVGAACPETVSTTSPSTTTTTNSSTTAAGNVSQISLAIILGAAIGGTAVLGLFVFIPVARYRYVRANARAMQAVEMQSIAAAHPFVEIEESVSSEDKDELSRVLAIKAALAAVPADVAALRKLSKRGIPSGVRANVWVVLLGIEGAEKTQLSSVPCRFDSQFELDVRRTNVGHLILGTPEGMALLQKTLQTFFVTNPSLEYWQGLDSLFSIVLLVFLPDKEETVLPALNAIATRFLLHILQSGDAGPAALNRELELCWLLLRFRDPELALHLESAQATASVFAVPWFVALFATCFPVDEAAIILDWLIASPVNMLPFLAMSLLVTQRQSLLELKDQTAVLMRLRQMNDRTILGRDLKKVGSMARKLAQIVPASVLQEPLDSECASVSKADRDALLATGALVSVATAAQAGAVGGELRAGVIVLCEGPEAKSVARQLVEQHVAFVAVLKSNERGQGKGEELESGAVVNEARAEEPVDNLKQAEDIGGKGKEEAATEGREDANKAAVVLAAPELPEENEIPEDKGKEEEAEHVAGEEANKAEVAVVAPPQEPVEERNKPEEVLQDKGNGEEAESKSFAMEPPEGKDDIETGIINL